MNDQTPYRHSWMTDEQWECMQFLRDFFGGFHNMDVRRVDEPIILKGL